MINPPETDLVSEQIREKVLGALSNVWDPELGLDIVALGLVYDVRVESGLVEIDMTLTTPGCPVSEQLPNEAQEAVIAALADSAETAGAQVQLNIVWDPPWTPELLSPLALEQLGFNKGP
ncbi:MAG: metal-sulfur cluster assembly factor [Acidimicrobiales bacterium]|nr:metal-sulfur cluster assembly factor [Acidimicrobiales bacterium]